MAASKLTSFGDEPFSNYRSTRSVSMPDLPSRLAAVSPVGPAPTMSMDTNFLIMLVSLSQSYPYLSDAPLDRKNHMAAAQPACTDQHSLGMYGLFLRSPTYKAGRATTRI